MSKLGARDVFSLVAGSMIGSGIFLVTPGILRDSGHPVWLLLVWTLSGIITLLGALSYAELAAMFPKDGGQLVFIRESWGKPVAFAYGFSVVFVIQSGVIAAVATAFALYLAEIPLWAGWSSNTASGTTVKIIAIFMIWFLSAFQTRGLKNSTLLQNIFTFSKVAALLFVIALGLLAFLQQPSIIKNNFKIPFNGLHFSKIQNQWEIVNGLTGLTGFLSACIGALFSMDAWNNATFLTERVDRPSVNMPKGLISGVGVVTILYLLTNISYLSMLPAGVGENHNENHALTVAFPPSDRVATAGLSVFFGNASALVVAFLIVISTFGCNNGLILSGSIFMQTMSRWKWLPSFLNYENSRSVPSRSLWFQAGWSSILVLSGSYSALLIFATFSSLLFYLITIGGLLRLRKTHPELPRQYRCPGYPVVPLLYLFLTGIICVSLLITDTWNCLIGLIFPFVALVMYKIFLARKLKK